jgi:hypothetical protein
VDEQSGEFGVHTQTGEAALFVNKTVVLISGEVRVKSSLQRLKEEACYWIGLLALRHVNHYPLKSAKHNTKVSKQVDPTRAANLRSSSHLHSLHFLNLSKAVNKAANKPIVIPTRNVEIHNTAIY